MAQVTIYLPDALEKEAKRRAQKAGKSLSAFFAELLARQTQPARWPRGFAELYGACDLPAIEDAAPDEVEPL